MTMSLNDIRIEKIINSDVRSCCIRTQIILLQPSAYVHKPDIRQRVPLTSKIWVAALESSSRMKILDKAFNVFPVQCCVRKG